MTLCKLLLDFFVHFLNVSLTRSFPFLFILTLALFVGGGRSEQEPDVLETLRHSSWYACSSKCKMHPHCDSVRFDRRNLVCELLSTTANSDKSTEDEKNVYNVTSLSELITGLCASFSCPSEYECFVNRLNQPYCSFPNPKPPAHGTILHTCDARFPRFKCDEDFTSCGIHDGIEYNTSGQRMRWNSTCSRNIWHDPTRKYEFPLPCDLHANSTIEVTGTPFARHFVLKLYVEKEVLFSLRLRMLDDKLMIMFNSYNGTHRGKRIKYTQDGDVAQEVTRRLSLRIELGESNYKIFIAKLNNSYTFPYKDSYSKSKRLKIFDDFILTTVRIMD